MNFAVTGYTQNIYLIFFFTVLNKNIFRGVPWWSRGKELVLSLQRPGLPGWPSGKDATCQEMRETWIQSLGREDPLEQKWQPTPVFLPGSPMDRGVLKRQGTHTAGRWRPVSVSFTQSGLTGDGPDPRMCDALRSTPPQADQDPRGLSSPPSLCLLAC